MPHSGIDTPKAPQVVVHTPAADIMAAVAMSFRTADTSDLVLRPPQPRKLASIPSRPRSPPGKFGAAFPKAARLAGKENLATTYRPSPLRQVMTLSSEQGNTPIRV